MTHRHLQAHVGLRCDTRSVAAPPPRQLWHSIRRPSADSDRPAVLRKWTVQPRAALAETLAPVSLTQTQESVAALKKTRLITAVKTPYREDGKFDLRAYDAHVQRQIENGIEGLIVGGTTGEVA